MKQLSTKQHLGIAFLILLISYVAFTLLYPAILPHPEDFSPYPDFLAIIVLAVACFRIRKNPHAWAYWAILLVCFLFFLDEIGYGVEIFGWPSLYISKYHVYIHDLHNLIYLGVQVAQMQLQAVHWNGALFANFLVLDFALLAISVLFAWLMRFGLAEASEKVWQNRILRLATTFMALIGLAAAAYLFTLPTDPKNGFLFGHSWIRIASAVGMLALSFLPAIFISFRKGNEKRIINWMNTSRRGRELPSILFVLVVLALIYQIYIPFAFLPDELARFERITPLVQWALAEIVVLWLASRALSGHYRKPFIELLRRTNTFLTREPAFIYAGFALFLIIIAQLIDIDVIPLHQWIQTPTFHIKLWGLWTEETFEMVGGGYEFLVAAYFFPRKLLPASSRKARRK